MTALIAAFLLDLGIGDPVYPFHPVRLMGRAIDLGETFFRNSITNPKLAGTLLALSLPAAVFAIAYFIQTLLNAIHPALGWIFQAFGIYTCLSIHDLKKEALKVHADLEQGSLDQA